MIDFVTFCNDAGADLSDADLRGADFSLANVTKVIIYYILGAFLFLV